MVTLESLQQADIHQMIEHSLMSGICRGTWLALSLMKVMKGFFKKKKKIQLPGHTWFFFFFFEMYRGSVKLTRESFSPSTSPNATKCVKLDGLASQLHFLYAPIDAHFGKGAPDAPICPRHKAYSLCNSLFKRISASESAAPFSFTRTCSLAWLLQPFAIVRKKCQGPNQSTCGIF